MAAEIKAFEVEWPAPALDQLRDRIRAFEFPFSPAEPGDWRFGCPPDVLRRLCGYWADGFDFAAAAAQLNRFAQFTTQIDGIDVHFLHVVGEAEGKRPLLLVHGWPGSVFEFWQVIDKLAFPSRSGGRAADAFDLVVPSLPGFGYSGRPPGLLGARSTARLFDRLMRERLGYDRYLAQGGDWGAAVCAWLGLEHAAGLRAIHLNYLLVQPAGTPQTAEEKAWRTAADGAQQALGAYAALQGTKPQSIAYAMQGNPVAQAAWLVERFHDWSDLRDRPFDAVFTDDQLLTNAMIYVMTDAFASAAFYYAAAAAETLRQMAPGQRVTVPTAMTTFPDPRMPAPPRSWVERGYNLTRWTQAPRGGHFAAMEVPDFFVADLQGWGAETG